jgi:hypothetical protein
MEELKYYDCTVKLYNDKFYSSPIKLSNLTFQLEFRYNSFSEAYHLTIKDSVGNTIASNKMVSPESSFSYRLSDGTAVELSLMFFKYLPSVIVPMERWSENVGCVARLIKWEKTSPE